jgi:putative membrane protein
MCVPGQTPEHLPKLAARSLVGGTLMGLANLVPGISGGTMLLAAGVYPDFIEGIAEVSTLRFRKRSLIVLGSVVLAAGLGILMLAGVVKDVVVAYRWAAYSLFIGLTLGGVPIVKDLLGELDVRARVGVAAGFLGMAALALLQASGAAGTGANEGFVWMFLAGVAGASAMILPGVSGGYLLLVLGAYVPILGGIDGFKDALKAGDPSAAMQPAMSVVLPVGLGVVLGVVVVSNVLKRLLERQRQLTLGVLLGLLVGAVVGLYPFQQGVRPSVGDVVKGQALTALTLAELDEEDWPTEVFAPAPTQLGGSGGLILLGLGLTLGIRRLSNQQSTPDEVTDE